MTSAARPENLAVLGEALNIDLELEAQERAVGPFRADILCKDIDTDRWVLIENQLERTDHTHLGQLLTYASGLDAVTIVWILVREAPPLNRPQAPQPRPAHAFEMGPGYHSARAYMGLQIFGLAKPR